MASKSIVKPTPRIVSNKANGRLGGFATAQKHGEAFCQARSEKAGLAVKAKYGSGFYSHIAKQRKNKRGWAKNRPRRAPWLKDPAIQNLIDQVGPTGTSV